MSEGVPGGTADRLQGRELSMRALEVLESNWLGHGTRPSRLYPHQWSWDSACIAMGYAGWNQPRAEMELRSLFAGQWASGLLPHIVFAEGDGRYFPGPDFWQVERSPDAPSEVRTSGIAQPPLHATAALRMFRRVPDRDRGIAFLRELAPKLHAWHAYLYRERTRGGGGLVEIWHPWESGMDNSPLWDEALARIQLTAAQVPEYRRVDVELANPAERPTDEEYDRYVYLVGLFRDLEYRADRIQDASPFALQPVLFNSLLVQANLDLAEIAQLLGEDPGQYEQWAELTAAALRTGCGASRRGSTWTTTSRSGARRGANGRGPGASLCRCADRRAGAPDGRATCRLARRGQRLGLGGDEPRTRRSRIRARRGTGEARSGRSSTGSCNGVSTGTATRRSRPRSDGP